GRDLSTWRPEIFRRQDAENDWLRSQFVPEVFWECDSLPSEVSHQTLIFGQVALGTVVTDLVQSFGVRPHAVIGYSLGESAALFALRAWTGRDEMLRRMQESGLFTTDLAGPCTAAHIAWGLQDGEPVNWVAGVIPCAAETVRRAIQGKKRVYL